MPLLAELDVVWLSRVQFALTIMFHYIFPPLTIGMGVVMVYLEGRYLWTKDPLYEAATKFWTQLFAVNFALGVATGIVMEFQFGTNWAAYSRFVGDVFGSALAAEGVFAFFLESGFLAVLVFGWNRVSAGFHFFATVMVALGSIFSSIWIVIANSWQQTPAGHHIVQMTRDGEPWVVGGEPVMRAEIVDFWAMVFNPSTMHRLVHVWIGAFILGAFFILSISAYYILRDRHRAFAVYSFRGALLFATIFSLAALVSGHLQANNVYETQPAKLAAFEGHFETGPADLSLFGIPDAEDKTVHWNIAIPGGLSFLIHEDFDEPVVGLDRFREKDQPPIAVSFFSYHIMVGLGMFFIALTLYASFLLWRGKLFEKRWLLWVFVFAVLGPFVANELGWVAAEVGRQPWVVHPPVPWGEGGPGTELVTNGAGVVEYDEGLGLRTSEAASETLRGGQVLGSIIMFSLIYALLFVVWVYVLNGKIQRGPEPVEMPEHTTEAGLLGATSARAAHTRSMTAAKDRDEETDDEDRDRRD